MRYSLAASALVLAATSVYGQTTSVYGQITSTSGEACESTYPTSFEITIVPVSDTAAVARRGLGSNNAVKHLSNMGKRQTAVRVPVPYLSLCKADFYRLPACPAVPLLPISTRASSPTPRAAQAPSSPTASSSSTQREDKSAPSSPADLPSAQMAPFP